MAQRRLGLYRYEVEVVLDGIRRFRRVHDLPDHDRGDLYGVAVGIIDLQVIGLEIADAHTDAAAHRERQYPPETRSGHGADITSEELDDGRLPRGDDHQRERDQDEHHDRQP